MPETPKRLGRPPLKITPDQVEKLAAVGLTEPEIGAILGCSVDTLQRRFSQEIKTGWERMKGSIRRQQYVVGVVKSNPTMLIWLGKQYLGQSDNPGDKQRGAAGHLEELYQAILAGPVKRVSSTNENGGSSGGAAPPAG